MKFASNQNLTYIKIFRWICCLEMFTHNTDASNWILQATWVNFLESSPSAFWSELSEDILGHHFFKNHVYRIERNWDVFSRQRRPATAWKCKCTWSRSAQRKLKEITSHTKLSNKKHEANSRRKQDLCVCALDTLFCEMQVSLNARF